MGLVKRVVAVALALGLLVGGGFLALAGMGYLGASGGTSRSWSTVGSLFAGLGVALLITIFTPRLNRPGSDGGSQSMEDESHGSTQEVPRRAA